MMIHAFGFRNESHHERRPAGAVEEGMAVGDSQYVSIRQLGQADLQRMHRQ